MNKKLSLNLDQLAVESFDTSTVAKPRGTVRAFDITASTCYDNDCGCLSDATCNTACGGYTCEGTCGEYTCGNSCVNICPPTNHGERTCNAPTCFNTCHDSCGCDTFALTGC